MKTGTIRHPRNHPLIIVRRWQIEACDGNVCAAALLSYFEYWHDVKLSSRSQAEYANKVAEMHGDSPDQLITTLQWHDEKALERGILIYKKNSIADGIKVLEKKGYVSTHRNPNSKYKFDRTRYFQFQPTIVQAWIDEHYPQEIELPKPENGGRSPENGESNPENGAPSPENRAPSPESKECTNSKSTSYDSPFNVGVNVDVRVSQEILIAAQQLTDCGVSSDTALELATQNAQLSSAWAAHLEAHPQLGPGLAVKKIRARVAPPKARKAQQKADAPESTVASLWQPQQATDAQETPLDAQQCKRVYDSLPAHEQRRLLDRAKIGVPEPLVPKLTQPDALISRQLWQLVQEEYLQST